MATPPSRVAASKRVSKPRLGSSHNCFLRLPAEILSKILSYLDASALFTISFTDKSFYQLANEDALWTKIYVAEFGKNRKLKQERTDEQPPTVATAGVQERPAGYWKWLYFRAVAARDTNKWKRHLRVISRYTGLPSQTERVLRNLHVTWELTVTDKSGAEATHELSSARFSETSVTLCWSGGGCLPEHQQQQISTLQLHGIRRIALNCPGLKKPGWRSLMATINVETPAQSAQTIGEDRLVELKLLRPGIVIGLWKGQGSVAFVMFMLHFLWLVERSTEGSWDRPYVEPTLRAPFDDIDPQYGLHGYHLHLLLHDTDREILSGSFSQLACQKTQIHDGLIQLTAIRRTDLSQHRPLLGSVTLPWRCGALQGAAQNCCLMNVTLLDEFGKPFWCVSSPVSMQPKKASVCYDRDGEHFLVHYRDSDGQVKMELVQMEEQKQVFLISLVVCVAAHKVNEHFSREY